MIKIGEKTFFLTDRDGNEAPWSVIELQSELIYCFLSAGLAENSCFAEDVALAVEYYLHQSEADGASVSTAEMTEIVIKTLENAGFYSVAECFRKRNSRELEILYSTNADGLKIAAYKQGILNQNIENQEVINNAAAAFAAMNVKQAPLGLVIEMLRFFYRRPRHESVPQPLAKKKIKGDYLFYYKDVADMLPDNLRELAEARVLKVNDVTVYHPSIRIYLDIKAFAKHKQLLPILTEMQWSACGNELGQSFDALIEVMQAKYNMICGGRELPVYLTISNIEQFVSEFFGVADGKSDNLAKYIIGNLSENMFNAVYKVRFSG